MDKVFAKLKELWADAKWKAAFLALVAATVAHFGFGVF